MAKTRSTLSLIAAALAVGIAPDPVIEPAAWASETLVVADGPKAGHRWSADLTPYAVEILNNLAAESPHNRVSVRKSAQTGLTEVGIAWVGSVIDKTPAKMMVVFPTISAVQDFNREKLSPTIEATAELRRKVGHRSRSSGASTALNKRFQGGSLTLTGANSASDLRSKTVKYLFCDEVDEWPLDLDGQGDPMEMAKARQTAFHAAGDYKLFEASTPTIKGQSRIDAAFEEGDQRYWQVPCPHCGEFQRLEFGSKDSKHGLKFSTEWPYNAQYVCKHCGALIDHHEKRAMVMAGKWVPEAPAPGRHPSYHIDALASLLTTWDKVAEAFLKARDDVVKLKAFVNLWLGEAWEERGDAPEWQRLYARRGDYPMRAVPQGGLVLTLAADVQGDGIYYETVAWGALEVNWSIDWGFLPGDTADPGSSAWRSFEAVVQRSYPDGYGNRRPIDLAGVDSGYNTDAVYSFVRRHVNVFALKGMDGWGRAAIGTASDQDVNWQGKKKRRGLKVWQVGTWSLKSKLYADLRKDGLRDGMDSDPPGYCHFSEFHDEGFFKQLTAEILREVRHSGRVVRKWDPTGPNHLHDCRIYNMALAAHPLLGLPYLTLEDWHQIAAERDVLPGNGQSDMEGLWMGISPPDADPEPAPEPEDDVARPASGANGDDWLGGRGGDWLERGR